MLIFKYDCFYSTAGLSGGRSEFPFLRCEATLAIPNVVMQPTLDEVQQTVNKAVQYVLAVFKAVAQWSSGTQKGVAGGANPPLTDRAGSVVGGDVAFERERRPSVVSMAPSEMMTSRTDLGESGGSSCLKNTMSLALSKCKAVYQALF